jgi:hypothetical protein
MPNIHSDDLIPTALAANSRAHDVSGSQTVLTRVVAAAIITAVASGLFTATVAEGAATPGDVQWVIEVLRKGGYGVTTSSTNIVITW